MPSNCVMALFGIEIIWPSLKYLPEIYMEKRRKSGYPVSRPIHELVVSRMCQSHDRLSERVGFEWMMGLCRARGAGEGEEIVRWAPEERWWAPLGHCTVTI